MKYLFLLSFLLIGCTQDVDSNGLTKAIYSQNFMSREGALNDAKNQLLILCLKHSYKKAKVLRQATRISRTNRNTYDARIEGICFN